MKSVTTSGVICLKDDYNIVYKIARIDQILYEDDTFSYTFVPYYNVMDLLPATLFQGIPGLDLSLRKAEYKRNNVLPVFISERTPGENRENLQELLADCNMDRLNRLEWLIRTKTRYSGDRLYVIRYDKLLDRKTINAASIFDLSMNNDMIKKKLLDIICAGDYFSSKELTINDANRREYYHMLMPLYINAQEIQHKKRLAGIEQGKSKGVYRGKKRIRIDEIQANSIFDAYLSSGISETEAVSKLGVSRSTFFRRLKEYKKRTNILE